ncbi:MAG: UDP-N-acetylmuramoyl-L-alanyl-D-glutamate--2,6-diaminopimelate ligase [Kofleriaceae bacterium]
MPIAAVRSDSRQVAAGELFVAMRGLTSDGHDHLGAAIAAGAAAVVVEREQAGLAVPQVVVPHGGDALGILVGRALGSPATRLRLIGVTGTNGKTTTSYLLEHVLAAAGAATGLVGTVSYRWPGHEVPAAYTTPTPQVLHETFAEMVAAHTTDCVMEVSSAALAMRRLAGVQFAVAAFSNLTQDHLDVHGDMASYAAAKRRLFTEHLAPDGVAVINVDDPAAEQMIAGIPQRVLRVSTQPGHAADVGVVSCEATVRGIRARLRTPRGELEVVSRPLLGAYNVANLALAVGVGEALGLPHAAIAAGLLDTAPPGRVERVGNEADLDVLVDYAHTPDALRNVLAAVRPLVAPGRGRLICVFGCGGDRDPGKRPLMGAAVAELADLCVVTSDNPRTEDPRAIIDAILPAVPRPFFVDVDRRVAIRAAIAEAVPGDIVVIAGKGHEDYQILGQTKVHFDDREEAAAAIARRPRWRAAALATAIGAPCAGDGDVTRVVIDGRRAAPGDVYVAIRGERHDGHAFCAQAVTAGATALVVEADRRAEVVAALPAGAEPAFLTVDDGRLGLAALGREVRRQWRAAADADGEIARLVAITGSSGKTTTKDLARAALSAAGATHAADGSLNNETGVPLTLAGLRRHHRYAVIEMGMRGLGQIEHLTRTAEPDVVAVVNAGVAHIELLGSRDNIAIAKGEIYKGLRRGGVAVVPHGDPRLLGHARANAPHARLLSFGDEPGADVRVVRYHARGPGGADVELEVLGQRRELVLPMIGRHAAIDAACALACALGAGLEADVALAGLARARGSAMRAEVVEVAGRHVIVDCYNANPASMAASIATLGELATGGRGVAIVGDMLELGAHAEAAHVEVGRQLGQLGLEVVALGEQKDVVVAAAAPAPGLATDDPAAAAARALARTAPGDWIMLKASRGMRLERVLDELRKSSS